MGRRDRRSPGPRRYRRLRPARRPAAAPQRQGHARSLSPKPLGDASPDGAHDQRRHARPAAAVMQNPKSEIRNKFECSKSKTTRASVSLRFKYFPSRLFRISRFGFRIFPMPKIPIIMPQLGESIAEATVVSISFKVGNMIESDQDILEVET